MFHAIALVALILLMWLVHITKATIILVIGAPLIMAICAHADGIDADAFWGWAVLIGAGIFVFTLIF